ncbi:MAG: hypothetical protein ACTHNP_06040 [Solirubrobacterales bacterium]
MKARGYLVCFVCAAAAALALPAVAVAKPSAHKGQNLFQLHVSLPDSNGYSMEISAEDHRHVELSASKGRVAVDYSVLGRASSHRVDADFGALGEVHIRLRLKPELVVPLFGKKRCGERIGFYGGRFRGNLDFVGEPGVPGVHSHRGGVSLLHITHACKHSHRRLTSNLARSSGGKGRPTGEVDLLSAKLKEENRTVSFEVLQFKSGRKSHPFLTFLSADVSEALGRVTIDRTASETAPAKVLRISRRGRQPETAVAEPAKPFAGSASYSVAPETPATWGGDLSVRLPGAGAVPLTGPGFNVELCRAFSASELEACTGSPALPFPPSVSG